MINGIAGWAKIRAQLAVWARTLTPSPAANPMAFVMISKSGVLILASEWMALAQTQRIHSQLRMHFCFKWHNSALHDGGRIDVYPHPDLPIYAIHVLLQCQRQH